MKHAQQHSRAEPESPFPLYKRQRRAASVSTPRTYLISHPECKTARLCTNGAPSCLRSLPSPSAIRNRLRAFRGLTLGRSRKRASTATSMGVVAQATRGHECSVSAVDSHPLTTSLRSTTSLQRDISRTRHCLCHYFLLYRDPQTTAAMEENTSIPSLRCLSAFLFG